MQAVHDGMCDFTILFCDDIAWICLFVTCNLQLVYGPVWMEGPWIQEPAHVAVQVASVGLTVKVSAMHAGGLYTLWLRKKLTTFNIFTWMGVHLYSMQVYVILSCQLYVYIQRFLSVLQCWGRFQSLQIMNSLIYWAVGTQYIIYLYLLLCVTSQNTVLIKNTLPGQTCVVAQHSFDLHTSRCKMAVPWSTCNTRAKCKIVSCMKRKLLWTWFGHGKPSF